MKIMSVNLRYINPHDKQQFKDRKDLVLQMLSDLDPDLIGFQEMMPGHLDLIGQDLAKKYEYYGQYRVPDASKEMTPLFYKKDKYELLESDTIWLSKTPEVKYSVGWDADLARVLSWGHFNEIATNNTFIFMNTHFDHAGSKAREESAKLVLDLIKDLKEKFDAKVILTGDFNTHPEDGNIACLLDSKDLQNSYQLLEDKENARTIHDFTGQIKGSPIDYIFMDKAFEVKSCQIIRYEKDGIYTSDHWHILCEIE